MTTTAFTLSTLLLVLFSLGCIRSTDADPLTHTELLKLLEDVRGDDTRIVRWDATEHTVKQQGAGACDALPAALDLLLTGSSAATADTPKEAEQELQALAMEYATFCITDNPVQRGKLAAHKGLGDIHGTIVKLVDSKHSPTSAAASHLIYIGSYGNPDNHQKFIEAGAVDQIAAVLKQGVKIEDESNTLTPVQIMWAAAALQNLAASYCSGNGDSRCYWYWPHDLEHVTLTPDSKTVISNGNAVREAVLKDHDLLEALADYVCSGPVQGEMEHDNPFPGENTKVGEHEASPNLIPWAAAGALKNIALNPNARDILENIMPCFCHMTQSGDWLERNKGLGAIEFIRRDDPCWFEEDNLCIDHVFFDGESTCTDYGDLSEEACETADTEGVRAYDACCVCGGGDRDDADELGEEL